MSAITKRDVEHAARLARLALTEEEKERFTLQLGAILDYIGKLNELDTSRIPSESGSRLKTAWREDRPVPPKDAGDILGNAPERDGDFFKVPRIIE